MATNQTNDGRRRYSEQDADRSAESRKTAQQYEARKKKKFIIFGVEIVLLAAMVGVLFFIFNTGGEGPNIATLPSDLDSLGIASEIQQQMGNNNKPSSSNSSSGSVSSDDNIENTGKMQGYWNIALFGLEATSGSQLIKGGRSDSIMIASVNLDTGDIKLVSVYRDTYLNINPGAQNATYAKCNGAYRQGGGEQAVKMLNSNLDMNITDYIAVGYDALEQVIDGLGGVYLDVDDTELLHINNYQYSIVKVRGEDPNAKGAYVPVTNTGYQLLNGLQAVAYCRIRYRTGNDFARAASQREVLMAMEDQIKKASIDKLTALLDDVLPNVVTSIQPSRMLEFIPKVADFKIVEEDGFPQRDMLGDASVNGGLCVIPLSLESNVKWLHGFLFEDEEYSVTGTVKEYSDEIKERTQDRLR